MEKRLLLAIALSFLVIAASSKVMQKKHPSAGPANGTISQSVQVAEGKTQAITRTTIPAPVTQKEYVFKNSRYTVHFLEPSAAISSVEFPLYKNYRLPLGEGLFWADNSLEFKRVRSDESVVEYYASNDEREITKTYIFSKDNYTIDLRIVVRNKVSGSMVLPMVLGQLDFTVNKNEPAANTIKDFTVSSEDGIIYPNPKKDAYVSKVKFAALRDRYFCVIVQPDQRVFDAQVVKLDQQRSELSLVAKNLQAIEGQDVIADFKLYIGPQDITYLRSVNTDWQAVVYFGKLNFIAHLLLSLLMFLYGIVRNWGVAIILFSLAIYFALFPLSLKQFKSMRQMQAIQPLLEKLREKYKDDQQRFAREQMALFKEHNINPLGGCLPLLLQIPIFITLYQVLTRTVSLKGAGFLWMKDLSLPDRLFILPISLPLIGNEINILPAIMSAGMVFQQKFTSMPQTGQAAEQQKIMMFFMPIMMFFIFYKIPAGVNLYWVMNSILMMAFQVQFMKKK